MAVAFTGFLGTEWTATVTGVVSKSNFDGDILPGSGADVVVGGTELGALANISNNVYQNYPSTPVSVNNLEVLAGGTVNANASLMTIHGSLVNAGSFNINSDTVEILGGIDNDGLMAIDGEHQSAYLLMDSGDFTLAGTGNLRMTSAVDGVAYLTGRDGELTTLTNDSRISGAGYIGASNQIYYPGGPVAIRNNGVIDANASGRQLVIVQGATEANPLLNEGSLVANGNGRLVIDQAYVEQSASGVIGAYGAGSRVMLADVVLRGGMLDASGGGAVYLETGGGYGADGSFNGAVLDGSSASGAVTITETGLVRIGLEGDSGRAATITGAIVNHGDIGILGYESNLIVAEAGATLTGGGAIHLSYAAGAAGNTGDARLTAASGAGESRLVNVDNLIHGSGAIGRHGAFGYENRLLSVVNQADGVIEADDTAFSLVIHRTVSFENDGVLRAVGGATLEVGVNAVAPNLTDIANGGGHINAVGEGSKVLIRAATIEGGGIGGSDGGEIQLLNGALSILDGSTSEGALTVTGEIRVKAGMLRGAVINQSEIVFDDEADAQLYIATEGARLTGGAMSLTGLTGKAHWIAGVSNETAALLTNAGTIEGGGYIGASAAGSQSNLLTLNNTSDGVIRALTGEIFVVDTSGAIVNDGILSASGGTLDIRDEISGAGSVAVSNGGILKLLANVTTRAVFDGAGIETLTFSSAASSWAAGRLAISGMDVGDIVNLGFASGVSLSAPEAFDWTKTGADGVFRLIMDDQSTRQFAFSGLTQTHFSLEDNGAGGLALVRRAVTEGLDRRDVFAGTASDDRIVGYAGNDFFAGSAGNDIFDGGSGIDTVSYAAAGGKVSVVLDDGDLGQAIGKNQGSDIFRLIENVVGSAFNDSLSGDAAANQLTGGKGMDTLAGNGGRDRLIGAAGGDLLTGGAAADAFVYLSISDSTVKAKGRDTIFDFDRADGDKINLDAIDANTKLANNQDFSFISGRDFSGKAGQLRFERNGDETYLFGDVNGDGKADFSILFDDGLKFRAGDFLL
jgi:Ca2+-binding RTX toxin-like protein